MKTFADLKEGDIIYLIDFTKHKITKLKFEVIESDNIFPGIYNIFCTYVESGENFMFFMNLPLQSSTYYYVFSDICVATDLTSLMKEIVC